MRSLVLYAKYSKLCTYFLTIRSRLSGKLGREYIYYQSILADNKQDFLYREGVLQYAYNHLGTLLLAETF